MKRRKKEERLNDIFVVNESGEEYVNFKNNETKLAVRSMLEEDVEYVSYLQGRSRKEKKQLLRKLQEEALWLADEPLLSAYADLENAGPPSFYREGQREAEGRISRGLCGFFGTESPGRRRVFL